MPPIEFGPTRPVGAIEAWAPRTTGGTPSARSTAKADKNSAAVVRSDALDPGETPPMDADRVSTIRHAIETDTYPVLPFKVADAMIAAGLLLRNKK